MILIPVAEITARKKRSQRARGQEERVILGALIVTVIRSAALTACVFLINVAVK
jgi:hypothetical protein